MWSKIFVIITNLSSIATLYYGHKYKEYTITFCIVVTSIISLIFHTFTEFNRVSDKTLDFFRVLDFYYSYKSIYVVTTNLLIDYDVLHYNYDLLITPILLTMATFLTEKNYFVLSILPLSVGIILPILYLSKDKMIKPNIYDFKLYLILILVLINILVYIFEKFVNYYIFHSIHHLICFSVPGLIIQYKFRNRNNISDKNIMFNKNSKEKVIKNKKETISKIPSLEMITETVTTNILNNINNINNQMTANIVNNRSSYTNLEDDLV